MRISRFVFFLLLSVLSAAPALAVDASGKWTAEVSGHDGHTIQIVFDLKADGGTLTGAVHMKMNGNTGEFGISEGKISGDQIEFKQVIDEMTILYRGTVSAGEIKFTRQREGGQDKAQPFTARKVS